MNAAGNPLRTLRPQPAPAGRSLPARALAACRWLLPVLGLQSAAANQALTELRDVLAAAKEKFTVVEIPAQDAETVRFRIDLAKDGVNFEDHSFQGFRFTVPEGRDNADFVWYFNAPQSWGNWYLVPVEGEVGMAFRDWIEADRIYRDFDQAAEKDRIRILQSLQADYFKPGAEYILWFRQVGENANAAAELRGLAGFAKTEGSWNQDAIEKALGLQSAPAAEQVSHLKSRGGKVLLDTRFFDASYGANRIDSALRGIRSTHHARDGFFITMKTSVPSCRTTPALADIIREHGEPDFTRARSELKIRYADSEEEEQDGEEHLVSHHYDYFSFEVDPTAEKPVVLRVDTHASDFSALRPQAGAAAFASLALENLTVFHREGREAGRAYFFLEGEKQPVFVTEPPPGEYRNGDQRLTYRGEGDWSWETRDENGTVLRRVPLAGHQMDGKAEGFHAPGKPSFIAHYRKGVLHGELIQYDEDGEIINRRNFVEGEPADDE